MAAYYLTDEEALLLDGRCRPEVQANVDAAKIRVAMASKLADLSPKEAGFIADVVREARKEGRLTFCRLRIRSCDVCGTSGGYYRYKSGPRRGQSDHGRPLCIEGVDLGRGFVVIKERATLGCCWACWQKLAEQIRGELADVQAAVPEDIMGHPPKWRRFDRAECTKCGWQGHEGEMRRKHTVMGDGTYPAGCPKCSAENTFLGPTLVKKPGGHVVVLSSEVKL